MIISCDLSTSNDTKIPNMQSKILNEHLKWMPVNSLVKMDESIFFKVDSRGKILFNLYSSGKVKFIVVMVVTCNHYMM